MAVMIAKGSRAAAVDIPINRTNVIRTAQITPKLMVSISNARGALVYRFVASSPTDHSMYIKCQPLCYASPPLPWSTATPSHIIGQIGKPIKVNWNQILIKGTRIFTAFHRHRIREVGEKVKGDFRNCNNEYSKKEKIENLITELGSKDVNRTVNGNWDFPVLVPILNWIIKETVSSSAVLEI